MAKDPTLPTYQGEPSPDPADVLQKELRRRGMTEAEIDQALRKKKRAKTLAFDAVKSRHIMPNSPSVVQSSKARRRETPSSPAEELCTVDFAARRLKLHPKTILRFLREGRLKGARIGKSYRILRADLEAFAGLPPSPEPLVAEARVTSIVEIPGVGTEMAARWASSVTGALNGRPVGDVPLRADVIHDAEASHLKIIIVGPTADTVNLLALIRVWQEQLRA